MSSDSEYHKKMLELLAETAKWARFEGIQKAREVLLNALTKEPEKIAYHYSDGRTSTEIAKLAGVSDFAIRSYWKKWTALGLVMPSPRFKGRYERIFSLEDLGIEIPARKMEVDKGQIQHGHEGGGETE